ncbi:hypothetical protein [Streptococcus jiangjianxini]|uniref:hypothetical protein n=1 Tax=Streptococcus jiangjianxini TaxID=3161189 RepID=UPI0032F002E0
MSIDTITLLVLLVIQTWIVPKWHKKYLLAVIPVTMVLMVFMGNHLSFNIVSVLGLGLLFFVCYMAGLYQWKDNKK